MKNCVSTVFILIIFFLIGCQQPQTKTVEESVDVFEGRTVLVDTRSALNYEPVPELII